MGAVYRLQQFWWIVTAPSPPASLLAETAQLLTPAEQAIFNRMPASDQWHSYRVMKTLQEGGYRQPQLLAAALLHDAGKTRVKWTVWDRILIVLAAVFFPRKMVAWGKGDPDSWRRPFVVKAEHPEWGAQMAEEAGSHPLVIALIRRHQETLSKAAVSQEDQLLRALQWADDQN